jgi:hypothetical protein
VSLSLISSTTKLTFCRRRRRRRQLHHHHRNQQQPPPEAEPAALLRAPAKDPVTQKRRKNSQLDRVVAAKRVCKNRDKMTSSARKFRFDSFATEFASCKEEMAPPTAATTIVKTESDICDDDSGIGE